MKIAPTIKLQQAIRTCQECHKRARLVRGEMVCLPCFLRQRHYDRRFAYPEEEQEPLDLDYHLTPAERRRLVAVRVVRNRMGELAGGRAVLERIGG